MSALDKDYWDNRYGTNDFPWDIGHVSPPLKNYFNAMKNKSVRILIPGAGNAYEAEYLYAAGFKNVYVLDFSPAVIETFTQRFPDFPSQNIFADDFFLHENQYDLIIEQTFFCAIDPSLREAYVNKMHSLLADNGVLAGLLFEDRDLKGNPPFGGTKSEYISLFEKRFKIVRFDLAKDSIKPRLGRELFFEVTRQSS